MYCGQKRVHIMDTRFNREGIRSDLICRKVFGKRPFSSEIGIYFDLKILRGLGEYRQVIPLGRECRTSPAILGRGHVVLSA